MIYGYGRVSTSGQCLDRQIDALKMAGVEEQNIFVEKMTGTKAERPQLSALKAKVVEGDVVLIESLSRLGRSSSNLISEDGQDHWVTVNNGNLGNNKDTATWRRDAIEGWDYWR